MQECGIDVTEAELIEMQTSSIDQQDERSQATTKTGIDFVVTFG